MGVTSIATGSQPEHQARRSPAGERRQHSDHPPPIPHTTQQSLCESITAHVFFASGSNVLGIGTGGGLVSLLLVLCLFYILLRIPFWAKEMVLSRRHSSSTARMAKTYVLVRVVKGALGGVL